MTKKEKLATIGTFIAFIGTLIPIFFDKIATVIWVIIVGIGFGFLIASSLKLKN